MAAIPSSQPFSNPQMQQFGYQVVEGATSNPLELDSLSTLLIRHLPEAIPHDTLLRLFSHYGASSVRPCSSGMMRNSAFVDFKNEALAYQAQRQLNGYAYPPPDGNILTNIVNALIAVPRFYTQVLHLMNKMNIPAPFRMALPTPPLPPSVPAPQPPPPPPASIPAKPHLADASSSESEMESSDEIKDKGATKSTRKRARREAIVGPAVDKSVAHEAVGVKPATLIPKEIPLIKKKNPVLQIKIAPKHIPNEQKDEDDEYREILEEPNEEDSDAKRFATADELEKGKLPPEEILSLPMFKNYTAGNPASVLYIKNLAKDVVPEDFYFIFGSLFGSVDAAKFGLNVKLMQEGRMRGQAFVTFPSVEFAHRALNLVNGYVFKGKPIIIQFGRNPAAAKTN
ncbi:U11/U12 small nuclear ribonucleoprotein 65 kDa protein-like isoform X5 [Durio zibethinus]|uniref:U11/U12 small nuclear ribonucleoprotein 65 kDa protein-like isoform X5 n=1 Tax=Durio zibethinus TaxID=66656 RepID=A0A6P5YUE9_DURZI|nr:U11/U12 small nuclear ribonucleoprotein 65 kDa protein-like isoform X5 [Durio zibethinus]